MATAIIAAWRDEDRRREATVFIGVGAVAVVAWAVVRVMEKLLGPMLG